MKNKHHATLEIWNGVNFRIIHSDKFDTKRELLDSLIDKLYTMKCEDGNHEWIENHCLHCQDMR